MHLFVCDKTIVRLQSCFLFWCRLLKDDWVKLPVWLPKVSFNGRFYEMAAVAPPKLWCEFATSQPAQTAVEAATS